MFTLAQLCAKQMLKQGSGNILNIGSIQAYQPTFGILDYASTKVGLQRYKILIGYKLVQQKEVNGETKMRCLCWKQCIMPKDNPTFSRNYVTLISRKKVDLS